MAQPLARKFDELRRVYRSGGVVGTAFSATRFLGAFPLPRKYAVRYRYRNELVEKALTPSIPDPPPLGRRFRLALAGHDVRLYYAYGFDGDADPDMFLSEYARKCAKSVNENPMVLGNKEAFHTLLEEHGLTEYLPEKYGVIDGGTFRSTRADGLDELVGRVGTVVIKEVLGGGGNRVYICERDGDTLRLHGKNNAVYDPEEIVPQLDRAIVTEFCEQARYLDRIYPGSPNTLRVVTMNPEYRDAFIPAAVQRIGTAKTGALDNFSQGGMSAQVGVETGEMGAAIRLADDDRPSSHPTHPDTDAWIEGTEIPEWPAIKHQIRELASDLPGFKYAGWDLLVTAPGEFAIIEANHFPDPDVIQIHKPLLADSRVREFFERNDVPV